MKKTIVTLVALGIIFINVSVFAQTLYTQTGTDKLWANIIRDREIPIGVNSETGIKGSKIDVRNDLVEGGLYASYGIVQEIAIHTVGNGTVNREDFPKWTRWYQEDGKTQVFRLNIGEYNTRNDREGAPRIEAESKLTWEHSENKWHEWVARITVVKAQEVNLFQIFADPEGGRGATGLMMIGLKANGDIYWNKRDGMTYRTITTKMQGKSIDIKVRDNGLKYELFVNGVLFETQNTPTRVSKSHFRWGMYSHDNMTGDALVFFSHAQIDGKAPIVVNNTPPTGSFVVPTAVEFGYTNLSLLVKPQDVDGDSVDVTLSLDGIEIRTEKSGPFKWGSNVGGFANELLGMAVGEHTFEALIVDERGASSKIYKSITIKPKNITSLDNSDVHNQLSIYPNPSETGVFHMSQSISYKIFDVIGNHILSAEGDTIDLSNLKKGTYLLKSTGFNQKLVNQF
jgi:hypothetical protein